MGESKIVVSDSALGVLVVSDSAFGVLVEENPFVISLGTSGPQGSGSFSPEDVSYVYTQNTAQSTWTIVHGLQFIPNITVVDSAGTVVEGDYSYPNENTIVASFIGSFAGKAYLS